MTTRGTYAVDAAAVVPPAFRSPATSALVVPLFANSPYLSNLASMYEGKQLTDVVIITTNRVNKKEEKIRAHR